MEEITLDYVQFDGYNAVYVNGLLVERGDEINFRDIAPIIRGKHVVEVNTWYVEETTEVKENIEDYPDGLLESND
jgi:hypothetical protein